VVSPLHVDDIRAAAERLRGQVVDTPCLHSRTLSSLCGCEVDARARQAFCALAVALRRKHLRATLEESLDLVVERIGRDAGARVNSAAWLQRRRHVADVARLAEQEGPDVVRRVRIRVQSARHEIARQLAHDVDRNRHLAQPASLADDVHQPSLDMFTVFVIRRAFDPPEVIDAGGDGFGQAQAGCVQQGQCEPQSPRTGCVLQLGGLAKHEPPLRHGQASTDVHARLRRTGHADAGPGISHRVVLVDPDRVEVLEDRDSLALCGKRQRTFKGPPQRRPPLAVALRAPARTRLRIGEEGAVGGTVLGRHRRLIACESQRRGRVHNEAGRRVEAEVSDAWSPGLTS
jgi:hypothetical protein